MSTKIKKICPVCRGDNVWKDANARFNEATQEWELLNIFDSEYCEDCDCEVSLEEEPIDGQKATSDPR